jgi:hypothetical protein
MAWQLIQSLVREFFAHVSPPVSGRGPWNLRGPDQHQLWTAVLQLRPLPPLCTGGTFVGTHRQQVRGRYLQKPASYAVTSFGPSSPQQQLPAHLLAAAAGHALLLTCV